MTIVQQHYDNHLGPIYTWMNGGADAAMASGAADVAKIVESFSHTSLAVDLGAGFGMHTIPLARQGFRVVAIDTCAALLDELQSHRDDLPIETVLGDLQSFRQYLSQPPVLVLCMGDTIAHLRIANR
jgi:2-polyprenyl-3-methyl-5-hydroxy-6-metoxy-1,4-benzoquinol methylase